MKKIAFVGLVLLIFSCNKDKKDISNPSTVQTVESTERAAQTWLTSSIEDYFANETDFEKGMQKMTTPKYFEYKTDMINVGLGTPGALSEDEFKNKWSKDFDLEKIELNSGFLLGAQDWGKIKVTESKLLNQNEESYTFRVVLSDTEFDTSYPSIIKVVNDGQGFKIADVQEDMQ